jgi:hypothetical protein
MLGMVVLEVSGVDFGLTVPASTVTDWYARLDAGKPYETIVEDVGGNKVVSVR